MTSIDQGRPSPTNGRTFYTLDAMRGVAALAVVTLHCPDYFGGLASSSHLAVDFFFLLSGFVIAHAYNGRLSNGMSIWTFARVRLIRLYPLYILGFTLGGLVIFLDAVRGNHGIPAFLVELIVVFGLWMLPTPPVRGVHEPFPFNGPSWSLFLEVAVNLLYGLFALRLSERVLLLIVTLGGAALILTGLNFGTLHVGWHWNNIWGGAPRVMFSFFAGVLIARRRDRLPIPKIPPLLLLATLTLALAIRLPPPFQAIYELTAAIGLFPALLVAAACNDPKPVATPTYAFLGQISYAVYAVHAPLYVLTHGLLNRLHFPFAQAAPWTGLGFWLFLLLMAWWVHRLYDVPVRRWATRPFIPGNR